MPRLTHPSISTMDHLVPGWVLNDARWSSFFHQLGGISYCRTNQRTSAFESKIGPFLKLRVQSCASGFPHSQRTVDNSSPHSFRKRHLLPHVLQDQLSLSHSHWVEPAPRISSNFKGYFSGGRLAPVFILYWYVNICQYKRVVALALMLYEKEFIKCCMISSWRSLNKSTRVRSVCHFTRNISRHHMLAIETWNILDLSFGRLVFWSFSGGNALQFYKVLCMLVCNWNSASFNHQSPKRWCNPQ